MDLSVDRYGFYLNTITHNFPVVYFSCKQRSVGKPKGFYFAFRLFGRYFRFCRLNGQKVKLESRKD